jgi:putative transposase
MPRVARIVVPDLPHHLTQRGNNRQDVFFVDEDRRQYLKLLADQCRRHGAKILGYCLMTNHVHLILIPSRPDSLAKAVGRTHWLYAQYINRLHKRSGHLWQNRFYCNAMDDEHCLLALRYVERNPIRARICRLAPASVGSRTNTHGPAPPSIAESPMRAACSIPIPGKASPADSTGEPNSSTASTPPNCVVFAKTGTPAARWRAMRFWPN